MKPTTIRTRWIDADVDVCMQIGTLHGKSGLSVQDGALTYNGHGWDCMSTSEQLRVATAIVRAMNPKCGFVLLDKLE